MLLASFSHIFSEFHLTWRYLEYVEFHWILLVCSSLQYSIMFPTFRRVKVDSTQSLPTPSASTCCRRKSIPLAARALGSCWLWRFRPRATLTERSSRFRRSEDLSATFEDLNIKSTGDVVQHFVHTTSLAADLLRGPGGKCASKCASCELSVEICDVLSEAQGVCRAFLPQVLRGHALVSQLLDLFVEAFAAAGQSSNAFKSLETPLVVFHSKAPLAMRKALQSRIVGAADASFILQLRLRRNHIFSEICYSVHLLFVCLHFLMLVSHNMNV